jgi:hypothetical protein
MLDAALKRRSSTVLLAFSSLTHSKLLTLIRISFPDTKVSIDSGLAYFLITPLSHIRAN